jgi:hypothetical protein
MTDVIGADFEKREPGTSFSLFAENNHPKGVQNPATVVIEPGGIVKLRYRGRRAGVRITKAAAGEFVGRSFLVKPRRENSGILPKTILSPSGKKIFSAATLPQKS